VQVNITQFQQTTWFAKNSVESNTIMKHLTYKISPNSSGWLRGTKIYLSVPKQYINPLTPN